MSVIDQIAEPHRSVLVEVLGARAPDLLSDLQAKFEPSRSDWRRVTDTLYEAMTEHWLPGWELDERGLAIDYAMGAFINAFIHVNDREREDRTP